jgi:hypothetical protein
MSGVISAARSTPVSKSAIAATLICAFSYTLYKAGLLSFPLIGDEPHFWNASQWLFADGLPSLKKLRTYNELATPLTFLIFGSIDYLSHAGIAAGRAINIAASLGTLAIIFGSSRSKGASALAVIGLLLCPYFLYVSPLLYTDAIPIFFTVAGIHFAFRRRHAASASFLILGIACRQYVVAFPVALLIHSYLKAIMGRGRWESNVSNWVSIASLIGWIIFFGGPGPSTGVVEQNIQTGKLHPDHGLYFLTAIGAYYVAVEFLIFRKIRCQTTSPRLIIAGIVFLTFLVFPPFGNVVITDTMGYLDKAFRLLVPDWLRMFGFLVLAILTCLRFEPFSLSGLIVYSNATLLMFPHIAWDKYALPALATLWLLRNLTDDEGDQGGTTMGTQPPPSAETSNPTLEHGPATTI